MRVESEHDPEPGREGGVERGDSGDQKARRVKSRQKGPSYQNGWII